MVEITFRTTDGAKWGTGKGSPLTKEEVDNNFWSVKQAIEALQSDPTEPLQIHDITVTGNQMTITLSDLETEFTVTIPTAAFRWTEAWQAEHAYKAADVFTANSGAYLVLRDHTSDVTFDPDDSDINGPFYALIFPYQTGYDFGCFVPGAPGTGIAASKPLFAHLVRRTIHIPINAAGSLAKLGTAPIAALSFPILKNSTEVGTIDFTEYSTDGTFTVSAAVDLAPGDIIKIIRPDSIDADAEDLMVTMTALFGAA